MFKLRGRAGLGKEEAFRDFRRRAELSRQALCDLQRHSELATCSMY